MLDSRSKDQSLNPTQDQSVVLSVKLISLDEPPSIQE